MQERADSSAKDGRYSDATLVYDSVLAVAPNNASALERAGLLHFQLGQLSRAYSRLLAAERLDQGNVQVRLALGRIALIRGKRDEARQEAATVLQFQPANADALLLFGASVVDPADVDDAIQRIEKAAPATANRAPFRLVLSSLHRQEHDSASAARIVRELAGRDTSWIVRAVARNATSSPTAHSVTELNALVDVYLLMNRRDLALASLEEFVAKDSSYLPAWRELSELAVADTNFADATKFVGPLLRRDSTDPDARVVRITARLAAGDARGAATESNALLAKYPWLTPARITLARAWLQQDSLTRAQSEFEAAVRDAPNYPSAVFELAGAYIRQGNPRAAADILNKLVAIDPNSVGTHALLGWAYRAGGEPRRGTSEFREILKVSPKSAQGPYWVGVGLAAEGRFDEAKEQLEAALQRSPGYAEALAQLAQIDFSQDGPGEAVDRVKKQLKIVPDRWQLWNILGLVYEQGHQDDDARDAYATAIRLSPREIEPRSHLASLDLRAGHADEGVATLREILNLDPKNLPALTLLGGELDRQGAVAGARDAYERVLQIDPRRADVANNLAVLLSRTGQDDARAMQLAELARSIDPKDPHIADTLGWLLCRTAPADSASAAAVYTRATGLLAFSASQLPANPEIQFHLGVASQKSGDLERARQAFSRALMSGAAFPGREEAQRALAALK
jgi:Tfp pilus assembly protein PilF